MQKQTPSVKSRMNMNPFPESARFQIRALLLSSCLLLGGFLNGSGMAGEPKEAGFSLEDQSGEYLDILYQGKRVARYMYAYDPSTPERLHETYKPYLHIFDADGNTPITKGPGGRFTHHRGIYIGWNRILFEGKRHDLWHMRESRQVHERFLEKEASPTQAGFVSLVKWEGADGRLLLREKRATRLDKVSEPFIAQVDFETGLTAVSGDLQLEGDPNHAGLQYRPANEIIDQETVYLFPREEADPLKDLDYPWVGSSHTIDGKRYSVIHLNHPDNPKNTLYSAYRDYGRFGAFFEAEVKSGETLALKYRILVLEGELPGAGEIQKWWDDFAGVSQPSPAPPITIRPVVSGR
jgi:hypothetical protein